MIYVEYTEAIWNGFSQVQRNIIKARLNIYGITKWNSTGLENSS